MGRENPEGPSETQCLAVTGATPTFQCLLALSSNLCTGCHFLECMERKPEDANEQHSEHWGMSQPLNFS